MTTATPGVRPSPRPQGGATPPELGADEVAAWGRSGTELIDLLTRARRLGPLSTFQLGQRRIVLVTGPEQVQHILAQHPDRYPKRSHRARVLLGEGVISATGEAWKSQRRLLQSQFTATGIRRYEQRIADAAGRVADRWAEKARSGEPTDVGQDMQFFALDTIWRSLTDRPLDDDTHRELTAVETVVASLPTAAAAPATSPETVTAALEQIDATAYRAIAAAREQHAAGGDGLLRLLLDTARTRPEYTDRLIRDELVTLLVAGHETTAKTLAWLFLLLDRHPGIAEWAAAAGAPGSPVSRKEAVQALISETLRLYPAVWLIPRHAAEDDLVDGYRIEAGTDLLLCPYLTHRDPELWPDPFEFDPTRFLTPGRRPGRPGAYLPFGIGPRACLGQQFALREMAVLLEALLPAYTPAFHRTPAGAVFGANLRPDGPMPARILPRPSAAGQAQNPQGASCRSTN
ncbi:cytochrome P450 [Kitasatospora atroaurantiaca]|uniref:Cytochrome P450 n=1 Tax=Kitasatospora atroaurantiaca TaxID=285545 RepID=A0A561F1M8_9ACTN|nr:cytochrome P450 [Kitasatospora atroaurantiaca]TWE21763.1 cytochrome P450 [Kitasatospora atroaurantiaca]